MMLRTPCFLLCELVALVLIAATPALAASDGEPFDVAEIFFELNDTDGDLGLHGFIDGDAWKRLTIEGPGRKNRSLLQVSVRGRLKQQGLTELFFESAEPGFDELSPEQFLERFPEGTYKVRGVTLDGEKLKSAVEISHVMPAPAEQHRDLGGPGGRGLRCGSAAGSFTADRHQLGPGDDLTSRDRR